MWGRPPSTPTHPRILEGFSFGRALEFLECEEMSLCVSVSLSVCSCKKLWTAEIYGDLDSRSNCVSPPGAH